MRKISATLLASTLLLSSSPVTSFAASYVTPRQCKEAEMAIQRGGKLPNPKIFHNVGSQVPPGPNFRVFLDTVNIDSAREAMDRWEKVSDGRITFTEVKEKSEGVISIIDKAPSRGGGNVLGTALNSASDHQIHMNPSISDPSAVTQVMTHELGHIMGLGHSCENTLMYRIFGPKQSSLPNEVEVAAVLDLHRRP